MTTNRSLNRRTRTAGIALTVTLTVTVTVIGALLFAISGVSARAIIPDMPPVPDQSRWGGVFIRSHRVNVEITDQLAVTRIEQIFVNEGVGLAEGTYLFPLPDDAAVSDLTLYIDGRPIRGQILDADEAQAIYTRIVRQMRDPVLLQYVGRRAIQANVFPIPSGQERKIEITYSHVLAADNGMLRYTYPLRTDYASALPVREVSVAMNVTSAQPISSIYSPDPRVSILRSGERSFRAGFEASGFRATDDFTVYYGIATDEISANLLTYRGSADEDGFFMLMLTPPSQVDAERVIPKDVIIVLDQSGSMSGEKWRQARAAAQFVLRNLNAEDRFNAIVFSSGYRIYADTLQPVAEARRAADWLNGLEAMGGTDINSALRAALEGASPERQTVVLFLTDGLPTEGVTDPGAILDNVDRLATPNLRIFVFGVGNDVDTFLLDSLSSRYGGTSVYVRPEEDIERQVSVLYSRITSPVLTGIRLTFDGVRVDDLLPTAPLPDLFAGQQMIVAGRYREGGTATVTLTGQVDGETREYTFTGLTFPRNAGGQPFVPRLWATRKIGGLLNQIRLRGENPELVESVVRLSIRYGIITPYTSYLIQENDIWPEPPRGIIPPPRPIMPVPGSVGRDGAAPGIPLAPGAVTSGEAAVDLARRSNAFAGADSAAAAPTMSAASTTAGGAGVAPAPGSAQPGEVVRMIGDRTFVLRQGIWTDTGYNAEGIPVEHVVFLSDEYFALLAAHPEIGEILALSERVLLMIDGTAYLIMPE